jgi:YfiR/HmsC-like
MNEAARRQRRFEGTVHRSIALAALLTLAPVRALGEPTPPNIGLNVLLKAIAYDERLASKGTGDFVVLVPWSRQPEEVERLIAEASVDKAANIRQRPIRYIAVPFVQLEDKIERLGASAVLLAPSEPEAMARIAAAAATRLKVYSLALSSSGVRDGALVGVEVVDGRPRLMLNQATAERVGANFSTTLLKRTKTSR